MNKTLVAAALLAAASVSTHAADVGVSINIGQPGFYGQIAIGNNYPQPALIYPQPIVVAPAPVAVVQPPIYLHVPVVQAQSWPQYCGRYNACGRPVYFVQEGWYNQVYVPAYRGGRYGDDDEQGERRGNKHGRGHGRGHGHDD